jgi:hypothetical protein
MHHILQRLIFKAKKNRGDSFGYLLVLLNICLQFRFSCKKIDNQLRDYLSLFFMIINGIQINENYAFA